MKNLLGVLLFLISSISYGAEEITYLEYPELGDYYFSGEKTDNEVILFFSPNCSACYHFKEFEKLISKYIINDLDEYEKIPVAFYPSWERGVELHFLIKNNFDKLSDEDIYEYIHELKKPLKTQYDLIEFFLYHDIDMSERDLLRLLESPQIRYQIRMSKKIANDLEIDTTPSIVITKKSGKRFLLTPEGGGFTNMIKAATLIINQEEKKE